jgi:glutamate dehydrogenase
VAVYLAADRIIGGTDLRRQLLAFDDRLPAGQQYQLLLRLEKALASLCLWALEHGVKLTSEAARIAALQAQFQLFSRSLGGVLAEAEWHACQEFARKLEAAGLPPEVARKLSTLPLVADFLPVITLMEETGSDLHSVARAFHELREYLGIGRILGRLEEVPVRDRWDRMTRQMLKGSFASVLLRLTRVLLLESAGDLEAFATAKRQRMPTFRGLAERMRGSAPINFHPFVLLVRALESLLE